MEKEVVIHLGFPRNASTYQQKYLYPLYEGDECHYVGANSDIVVDINEAFATITQSAPFDCDIRTLKQKVKKALARVPQKKIILSMEELVGPMYGNFVTGEQIARLLKEIFGNVRFIVILRRQDRFVESMYRIMVRMGYFHSLAKYLFYYKGEFYTPEAQEYHLHARLQPPASLNVHSLFYSRRVAFYQELLSKDKVLTLPLEMLEEDAAGFVKKVSDFIGVKPGGSLPASSFNASYPLGVIKFARIMNRFALSDTNGLGFLPLRWKHKKTGRRTLWEKLFSRLDLEYFYLFLRGRLKGADGESDPVISAKIREMFAVDNKKLSKLIGVDLKKYEYY